MDNEVPKTCTDGKNCPKDKGTDTKSMPDKRCGDFSRACRKGPYTSADICAAPCVSEPISAIYKRKYIPKTTDGV